MQYTALIFLYFIWNVQNVLLQNRNYAKGFGKQPQIPLLIAIVPG